MYSFLLRQPLLLVFVVFFGTVRAQVDLQSTQEVITLLDLNQQPRQLNLKYRDNLPVEEGYLVVLRDGNTDGLYHLTESELLPLYTAADGTAITLTAQSTLQTFLVEEKANNVTAFSVNNRNFQRTELSASFISLQLGDREETDIKILPNGRLTWWDDIGLLSSAPPYRTSERLLDWAHSNPDPLFVETYRRDDDRLLIRQDNGLYVSDGTPGGSHYAGTLTGLADYEVHQSDNHSYLTSTFGGVHSVDAAGTITELHSGQPEEVLFAVPTDSGLNYFVSDVSDQAKAYRTDGTVGGTMQVELPVFSDLSSSIFANQLSLVDDRLFMTVFFRDSVALYTADANLSDFRQIHTLDRPRNSEPELYLTAGFAISESSLVALYVKGPTTPPQGENQLWYFDNDAAEPFRRFDVASFDEVSLPFRLRDGRYLLQTTDNALFTTNLHLLDPADGSLLGKGTQTIRDFEFREAGDQLYGFYEQETFNGDIHGIVSGTDNNASFDDFTFGHYNDWPGTDNLMAFDDRLTAITKENGTLTYFHLYYGQVGRVAEPIPTNGLGNEGSIFTSLRTFDGTVISLAEGTNASIALNGPDEVSYWTSGLWFGFLTYLGAEGNDLFFREASPSHSVKIFNREFEIVNSVPAPPRGSLRTGFRDPEVVLFKGMLYYHGRHVKDDSTTVTLYRRTPEFTLAEEKVYEKTFLNGPFAPTVGIEWIVANNERLYFSFPNGQDHFTRMVISTDGTPGGIILPESTGNAELFNYANNLEATDEGLFFTRSILNGQSLSDLVWVANDGQTIVEVNGIDFRGIYLRTNTAVVDGDIVLRSRLEGQSTTGLLRIKRSGGYTFEEHPDILWFGTFPNGEVIVSRYIPETEGSQMYTTRLDGTDPETIAPPIINTTRLTSHRQNIVGNRLYYFGPDHADLRFYDPLRRVHGVVSMPSHISTAPEAFKDLRKAGSLLCGIVESNAFGREPFYLDPKDGRLVFGNVYTDENGNGAFDGADRPVERYPVIAEADAGLRLVGTTTDAGQYAILVDKNTAYDLGPLPVACDPGFAPPSVSVPIGEEDVQIDFRLEPTTGAAAAEVYLAAGRIRCQNEFPVWVTVRNTGCSPLTGALTVNLPEGVSFSSADGMVTDLGGNELLIDVTGLRPLELKRIQLLLTAPDETLTGSSLTFGATLTGSALMEPVTATEMGTVFCSYDPNDKSVSPQREDPFGANYSERTETLEYTIRFQNTGNDTAYHVRIEDQLSAELDAGSLKLIAQSHSCAVNLDKNHLLTVTCDNIYLPDSTTNLDASQGFIRFAVTPLSEGATQTRIENTAEIYFDGNSPIVTNTVFNTIVPSLDQDDDGFLFYEDCVDDDPAINPGATEIPGNGIDENCDDEDGTVGTQTLPILSAHVFPNPFTDYLHFSTISTGPVLAELYNGRGTKLRMQSFREEGALVVANLPSGAYLLRLTDERSGATAIRWVVRR